MEEIIELKAFENKVQKSSLENKGEFSYLKLVELMQEKREKIKDIWHDRLAGAPKSVDVWYKILSIR
jgi:FKBP12-rapamycin complex-associated protein